MTIVGLSAQWASLFHTGATMQSDERQSIHAWLCEGYLSSLCAFGFESTYLPRGRRHGPDTRQVGAAGTVPPFQFILRLPSRWKASGKSLELCFY